MDNPETQVMDNPETQTTPAQDAGLVTQEYPTAFSWKDKLGTDLKNSPFMQKFNDDAEGLGKAMESYGNLEKLLGHEKVPVPKGPEDKEGWSRFSKAMGIPDKAEGYGLGKVELPEEIQGLVMEKDRFAEIAHSFKLTKDQTQGLWKLYNEVNTENYRKLMQEQEKNMDTVINQLRGEWGDAYDTNVELGQMVINKFADSKEMNDFITAQLSKSPYGIKFLAKLGDQFAENKISEFQMKRFSMQPEEMQAEIDKMTHELDGPYMNQSGKFTEREHVAAMDRVNHLRALINKARQGQAI